MSLALTAKTKLFIGVFLYSNMNHKYLGVFGILGILPIIIIISVFLIKQNQDRQDSVIKITYIINGKEVSKSEFGKIKSELQISETGTEGEREDGFTTYYEARNKKGRKYEYIESHWADKKIFEINEK